jgi:hypothetical protein
MHNACKSNQEASNSEIGEELALKCSLFRFDDSGIIKGQEKAPLLKHHV